MKPLASYLGGRWIHGTGATTLLLDPSTEQPVAEVRGGGHDLAGALDYARTVGGPALRALTFRERGAILRQLSRAIHAHRDELIALGMQNGGNTRSDGKFDVDGASGTLGYYAELGETLGDVRTLCDGDGVQLGRSPRLFGQHVLAPRRGVALHVNAFNFPAWGTAEKAACALLAGMPVFSKPATATALVAHRITEILAATGALPDGAFQLLLGPTDDLLDRLGGQDVLAFTGSGQTGALLRGGKQVVAANVRVNVEADSLNSATLAPDVEPGSPTWELFVAEIAKDVLQKTGQKCTATRRILVPRSLLEPVREALGERFAAARVGNPVDEAVTMGPLATAKQLTDVRAGLARLRAESDVIFGGDGAVATPIGAPDGKGYFFGPVLLENRDPASARATHEHEVFGPVTTLIPYSGEAADAAALVRRGEGGLVGSVYGDDRVWLTAAISEMSATLGRVYLGSAKVVGQTAGPGTVLPHLVHGGPGRAGGGEELGGARGLAFYQQRTALSGDRALLDAISGKA